MEKEDCLSEKIKIENWRDDDWFNEHIWEDDLDKNEIVKLVLDEVNKDIREAVLRLKDKITNSQLGYEGYPPEDKRIAKEVNKMIDKEFGDKLT